MSKQPDSEMVIVQLPLEAWLQIEHWARRHPSDCNAHGDGLELTPFQLADLDRLLCVRLGIAPTYQARHEYWDHAGNPCDCVCGAKYADSRPRGEKCPARCDSYPKLSTTGEGMLALMGALKKSRLPWGAWDDALNGALYFASVVIPPPLPPGVGTGEVSEADSAPLALALAAAAALGIEAPE